jgi:RimJ/RimL family protein N-acetyltransferase
MQEIAIEPFARIAWPVRTDRLLIRPARPSDRDALGAYRGLPEVAEWLSYRPADPDDWKSLFSDPERLPRTLVIEHAGKVIGDLFLKVEDGWAQREAEDQARGVQAEIGWCLDPAHAGHGYATEAARALLRLCFADLGLRRVVANSFADNEASWRLMERLGMRRESYTVRDSLHRERGWVDGVSYALLADEWRKSSGCGSASSTDVSRARLRVRRRP